MRSCVYQDFAMASLFSLQLDPKQRSRFEEKTCFWINVFWDNESWNMLKNHSRQNQFYWSQRTTGALKKKWYLDDITDWLPSDTNSLSALEVFVFPCSERIWSLELKMHWVDHVYMQKTLNMKTCGIHGIGAHTGKGHMMAHVFSDTFWQW